MSVCSTSSLKVNSQHRVPEDGGERRKLLPWHQHFQFSGLLTCHMDHCRHSSDGLPAISVLSQIRMRHTQVPVLFFFLQLCLSVCLCIVTVQMCRWKCKWLGADLIKCFSLVRESFIASAVAFPWHFPRRSAMLWFKDFSHYFPCHLHLNHRNFLFARSNFLLAPRSTTERDPLRDTHVFLSSFRGSGVIFRLWHVPTCTSTLLVNSYRVAQKNNLRLTPAADAVS